MSLNPRLNRVVRQAALLFACSASFACSDSDSAPAGEGQDAGTHEEDEGLTAAAKPPSKAAKSVTIRFRAAVADRDFSCLERYENVGSSKTTAVPADFRFYVQDLKLIDSAGKEVPVELEAREPWQTEQVALLDFEDMEGRCHGTPETNDTITGKVPAGEYTGVVFTNGVPEEINHLDQAMQSAPLDLTDLYWSWLSGYRFIVAELAQDTEADGADTAGEVVPPGIGLMHIGSTSCRRDKGCNKPNRNVIRLDDFDPDSDVIVADIAAIFEGTDVAQDMQCHAADEICAPMFERVGVDFASGESMSDAQKLYRIEPAREDF